MINKFVALFCVSILFAAATTQAQRIVGSQSYVANQSAGINYNAPNYGTCTWGTAAGNDAGPCIQAAINVAAAAGGGTVQLPAGTYYLATALTQVTSGVHIKGAGTGNPRTNNAPSVFSAITKLQWTGAAGATMFTLYAGSGGELISVDVTGVTFDCLNTAAVCAHLTNVSYSTLDIGGADAQSVNIWMDTNGNNTTPGPGNQHNDIWFRSRSISPSNTYSPTGILLDSGAGSYFNTSYNRYHELYAWFAQGDGIVFGNVDNDIIYDVAAYANPTNSTGKGLVFASSGYVMPNGNAVNGNAYDNLALHVGTAADVQGFTSGSTITAGTHAGSENVTTVQLTTNGSTAQNTNTLNFASTTNVLSGMSANCGGTVGGVMPNTTVSSVTGSTVVLQSAAIGTVATSTPCVFSYGVTGSAASGSYTLTWTSSTQATLTAPAGGHTQSGITLTSGALTFTDMVIPFTGSPATNDTYTIVVPNPAINITFDFIDKANSVPIPVAEPGAYGWATTSRTPLPQPLGGTGNISLTSTNSTGTSSYILGGMVDTSTGASTIALGGFALHVSGFGAGVMAGGANTDTGTYSAIVAGQNNTVGGSWGFIGGGLDGTDRNRDVNSCFGGGQLNTLGDAQTCTVVLRGTGASTSAIRLTANNEAAGAGSCVNIPNNAGFLVTINVMAFDHTTVTKNEVWPAWTGLLTRGANAAATAITMNSVPTPISNGTVTGSSISATADTTNGCINLSFTPPTSNTDTWNAVATVTTVEAQ